MMTYREARELLTGSGRSANEAQDILEDLEGWGPGKTFSVKTESGVRWLRYAGLRDSQPQYTAEDPDASMPGALGTISGIMSNIVTESRLALRLPYDPGNPVTPYREALQRILSEAERAERAWSAYINRELPEHS
jgi:hypothetical protein